MLRPSFKLGDKFIPKPFIEYIPQNIDGFNPNQVPTRNGYLIQPPIPRIDMTDPLAVSPEKLRELTNLASVSIDVPDPSDKTYITENRPQRTIKRSILPSAIPNLSTEEMKSFVDSINARNTTLSTEMKGALKLVEKSLFKKLVAGDEKVIDALKPMTSYIKTSEVPQFCFVYTLKETKEYNIDMKTGILRNDIYIKLIKNKDNFIPKTGYDFGRFLARLSGNKVEIGDIVDTENCIYYKMTDTKIADYNNMVVVALQDLTFFSSVNGVKTTNFINALEQGYKNHFGGDLPTIA
jgi:hypothetical protein